MKFWRDRNESDLDAEIDEHLTRAIRDRVERGETEQQARANALREFGDVVRVKEITREMWGWASLERFGQDLRFGLRMMKRKPVFSFVAVFTLALGIGANTAIFSVCNALILKPLPYHQSDRLVLLTEKSKTGEKISASFPNFVDWRSRARSFEGMAASCPRAFVLSGEATAALIPARFVSWIFFHLLGVAAEQ